MDAVPPPAAFDADGVAPEELAPDELPESTSKWIALLFAGTLMCRFPATTSTCSGGSVVRTLVAERGTSGAAAAGAGDLTAGLRSRNGAADVLVAAEAIFLLLLRNAASCVSPSGGNQKSQSFTTTATSATTRIPSAMSMRFRCNSTSGDTVCKGSGVERSRWLSVWVSS